MYLYLSRQAVQLTLNLFHATPIMCTCQTTAGGSMSANASKYIIISYIKLCVCRETKTYLPMPNFLLPYLNTLIKFFSTYLKYLLKLNIIYNTYMCVC